MRRLVVCMDGTGQSPRAKQEGKGPYKLPKPSNVLKIYRAVKPRHKRSHGRAVDQICFYDEGVGAEGNKLEKLLGGGLGVGFGKNVQDAYRFLVGNYVPGDKIFLFGYSRGAAQAMSLCRFIDWCGGLLCKSDAYYIPEFFDCYCRTRAGKDGVAKLRKGEGRGRRGSIEMDDPRPVEIEFLGLFDAVFALFSDRGSKTRLSRRRRAKYNFHVPAIPPAIVKNARQALVIDERRKAFWPSIWSGPASRKQSLEQRWFAGVHGNVGGGYGDDGMANCALRWMTEEAENAGLGFCRKFLGRYRAWYGDRLYNSFRGITARAGSRKRVLGPPKPGNQVIDPTVFKLIMFTRGKEKPYRPGNLANYLRKNPAAMAGLDKKTRKAVKELLNVG